MSTRTISKFEKKCFRNVTTIRTHVNGNFFPISKAELRSVLVQVVGNFGLRVQLQGFAIENQLLQT